MTYTFKVNGMTCGHCEARIKNALLGVKGIKDVAIDLGSGIVNVTSEEEVGLDVMAAVVEETGYADIKTDAA